MWEFIIFVRDCIADLSGMLDSYIFSLGGIIVSIWDLLIGFVAMGLIIAVFWKGSRV